MKTSNMMAIIAVIIIIAAAGGYYWMTASKPSTVQIQQKGSDTLLVDRSSISPNPSHMRPQEKDSNCVSEVRRSSST